MYFNSSLLVKVPKLWFTGRYHLSTDS